MSKLYSADRLGPSQANQVIAHLLKFKGFFFSLFGQDGKVTRTRLGIVPQDVTPAIAEAFGEKDARSALVGEVSKQPCSERYACSRQPRGCSRMQ